MVTLLGTVTNDNTASITQTSGENHNANIFQSGGRFNMAGLTQNGGSGAQALIVQTSNSQRALAQINQTATGTNNSATILQFTGSNADSRGQYGNQVSIDQVAGSNNVAFVQQGGQGFAFSSNDNFTHITQNGTGNTTRFLQAGDNNTANIIQTGNNNLLRGIGVTDFASQRGYNNTVTINQNSTGGAGWTYQYTQVGNNNTQVIDQHY